MSTPEINVVSVSIMDREFKVKCPEDKVTELQAAAGYLDGKMRDIYRGEKYTTIDRVAVIAALNITHELFIEKQQITTQTHTINQRLNQLKNKIDEALTT